MRDELPLKERHNVLFESSNLSDHANQSHGTLMKPQQPRFAGRWKERFRSITKEERLNRCNFSLVVFTMMFWPRVTGQQQKEGISETHKYCK